jgi:hypothetical protein
MLRIPLSFGLLAIAGCTPANHHREAERPVPVAADAYACAQREVRRMGYEPHDIDPGTSFTAERERPQPPGARFSLYDYLSVEVRGNPGAPRTLRVGAVTRGGGDNGVAPHFRPPVAQTEADRDSVLRACAPSAG